MTDPWDVQLPFVPMFSETVEINGVRAHGRSFRSVFKACVYPPEKEEPFADSDADTKMEKLTLLVLKRGLDGWT